MPDAKQWDGFWSSDRLHRKLSWSKRRVLAVLDGYVRPGMTVLDAGCGSGFFSSAFLARGCRTTALDYSPEALRVAREITAGKADAYLETNLLDPGLAARVSDRSDLIFSDGLFEHFTPADQDRIFRNLMSVLAPGGFIITFVPNCWSPWELIRPFYMPGIEEKPFTLKRLRSLYSRNGAIVTECGGINVLPVRFSPERLLGPTFGMLLYCIGSESSG